MQKILPWVFPVSVLAFLIDWGIVGLKIMDGKYDFIALVYAAAVLLVVMFGCILFSGGQKANATIAAK